MEDLSTAYSAWKCVLLAEMVSDRGSSFRYHNVTGSIVMNICVPRLLSQHHLLFDIENDSVCIICTVRFTVIIYTLYDMYSLSMSDVLSGVQQMESVL